MEENNPNVNNAESTPLQNPATPPPTVTRKSVYKSKLFLIAIAFFIILILTIAASVFANLYTMKNSSSSPRPTQILTPTPTPSPTQTALDLTWKTYSGDGFSFKYPNDWKNLENGVAAPYCLDCAGPNREVSITITLNPNNLTLAEFEKQAMQKRLNPETEKLQPRTPIDGHETLAGDVSGYTWATATTIADDNRFIDIYCVECTEEFNNQILSTFRFE